KPDRLELDGQRPPGEERPDRGDGPRLARPLPHLGRREGGRCRSSEDEITVAPSGSRLVLEQNQAERRRDRYSSIALLRLRRDLALDVVPPTLDPDLGHGVVNV